LKGAYKDYDSISTEIDKIVSELNDHLNQQKKTLYDSLLFSHFFIRKKK